MAAETVADRIRYHREQLGDKASEYETFDDLLRILIDTDGDFQADKATVFASGFNGIEEGTGAGALVRGDRIYYTNIPKLWALVDKDDDGVADERIILSDGYGVRVAFRGHDMHGLILGPDGRLYFSIGDRGYHVETPTGLLANPESGAVFRCELDGSKLEVVASGLRNPQELAFDDFGNLFTGDNNSDSGDKARWVYIVRGGDTGWRMMYQYISDRGPFNREKIWHPFSGDSPAYTVPPISNLADGPSGLACYPGTGFLPSDGNPNQFTNAFFLCDFRGQASNSGIRMIKVNPKGAFFELKSNDEFVWNILATDVEFGPDGGMYVSDWVNGWNGENKGRIYRFADEKAQASDLVKSTRGLLRDGMKSRGEIELGDLLGHPDRRVRLEAQWELANRGNHDIFISATQQADTSILKRLHCNWGLGQLLRSMPSAVVSRVLNASFRLGRDQDAVRLANFAAKSPCKDALRIEALDMLSNWAQPGDRDRVMNRHQPLSNRDPEIAVKVLKERIEELSATPQAVRDKFLEVGAKAGLMEIAKIILVTAKDKSVDGVRRGAAIKALTSLAPDSIQPLIKEFLQDPNVDVRMASMAFQVSAEQAYRTFLQLQS